MVTVTLLVLPICSQACASSPNECNCLKTHANKIVPQNNFWRNTGTRKTKLDKYVFSKTKGLPGQLGHNYITGRSVDICGPVCQYKLGTSQMTITSTTREPKRPNCNSIQRILKSVQLHEP